MHMITFPGGCQDGPEYFSLSAVGFVWPMSAACMDASHWSLFSVSDPCRPELWIWLEVDCQSGEFLRNQLQLLMKLGQELSIT